MKKRLLNFFSLLIGVVACAFFIFLFLPLPDQLSNESNEDSLCFFDNNGNLLRIFSNEKTRYKRSIPLSEMGDVIKEVTVAVEDQRFYQHHGIDIRSAFGALLKNFKSGKVISGASTITQQLVKNSYNYHSYPRIIGKIYENVMAVKLEWHWSKQEILERYLNCVSYGNRFHGIFAASQQYFSKNPKDLNIQEAIYLVGIPRAPSIYNPWNNPENTARRYELTLNHLLSVKVISMEEKQILSGNIPLVQNKNFSIKAKHFTNYIYNKLHDSENGDIVTTLDLEIQNYCQNALSSHLNKLKGQNVDNGAVVVIEGETGEVVAYIGAAGAHDSTDDIDAVQIARSCGSTLKPFLYLKAIEEQKMTAASLLPDTQNAIRSRYIDYDPKNYDNTFRGPVRLREALGNSLNIPAIYALSQIGARDFYNHLQDKLYLDLPRGLNEYGAGLILGNAEVSLLNLVSAYTVLSNEGVHVKPRFLNTQPQVKSTISTVDSTLIIEDIMTDNEARSYTFGNQSPLYFEKDRIAVKTGTSSGFRDAWSVGYGQKYIVGVWVGNLKGNPMDEISSVDGAVPVWRNIMDYLLSRDERSLDPVDSKSLIRMKVCKQTGLQPGENTRSTIEEYFLRSTEPENSADSMYDMTDPKRIILLLPPEYQLWCMSSYNFLNAKARVPDEVEILSPVMDAKYQLTSYIPEGYQKIKLQSNQYPKDIKYWKVNDQYLQPNEVGEFYLPLKRGNHILEIALNNGLQRSIQISVE